MRPRMWALCVIALSLVGCAAMSSQEDGRGSVWLGEEDHQTTTHLAVGEELVIALFEEAGDAWELEELDASVLEPLDPGFSASSYGRLPSGGRRTLRFRAVQPGRTDLRLVCGRGLMQSERSFEVRVVVR